MATPQPTYTTIQIPGIQDIIRIPVAESKELKQERIFRLRNARTAIPSAIDWIPDAINWIDDRQDLLVTALLLLRPALRRLPAALIPYLGWILLANDLLNLASGILGFFTTARFPKRDILDFMSSITTGRAGRITLTHQFLNKRFPWMPFFLQAGQVAYNYTGYGLQLGTIMGAMSDFVWAQIQGEQRTQTRIIGPPPSDIASKAARVLTQEWMWPYLAPVLTFDEIKTGVAASAIATQYFQDQAMFRMDEDRLEVYGLSNYTGWEVWNTDSRAALTDAGITGTLITARPGWYSWAGESFRTLTEESILFDPYLDQLLSTKVPPDAEGRITQQLYEDTALRNWDIWNGAPDSVAPMNTPWERLMSRMWHENTFPPWEVEPCDNITASYNVFIRAREAYCRYNNFLGNLPNPQKRVWRAPRVLPPLYADHNWQIIWFLTIALAMRCGYPVPHITNITNEQFGPDVFHIRTYITEVTVAPLDDFFRKHALKFASVAVWGNIWSKNLKDITTTPLGLEQIPFCIKDPETTWPRLTGITRDSLNLAAIRQALPGPGELASVMEWTLDNYDAPEPDSIEISTLPPGP